ncbi:hypothetical protein RR42_s3423 [Cupriavidus basilensis]|uniref:Uncharacterized protein n=1 Tax=Cupriavidus basilensis TaxID=68895 RepID=A0A0C4YSU0_9BURK|nr:hypothetical protein RR42_s3423 [Cupriavidus basilensis]
MFKGPELNGDAVLLPNPSKFKGIFPTGLIVQVNRSCHL